MPGWRVAVALIVVVGDSKQFPPTRFFTRLLGEDGESWGDADTVLPADVESILGLCCAQGLGQRLLQWHYRSRHHSLIAVSNREFYDDRLYVIPSPGDPGHGQGLSFHRVENGVFDREGLGDQPRRGPGGCPGGHGACWKAAVWSNAATSFPRPNTS